MPTLIKPHLQSLPKSLKAQETFSKDIIKHLKKRRGELALRIVLGCMAFTLVCALAVNLEPNHEVQHTEKTIEKESPNIILSLGG